MLFYVAPFQATFRFYYNIVSFIFTTTLTTKTTFSVGTADFGDMSPLILSKLFKLSSINNLVVSSILRELFLSLYHHVKEHL